MEFNFERKLIELMKGHPILYDLSHRQYKNNAAKKNVWDNLAQQLDLSSKDLQAKWRNLKKRYSSSIQEGRSGDAPKILNKKNLFIVTEMDFFRQYFQDNSPTESNLEQNTEPDTNSSGTVFQELFNDTANSLGINDYEETTFASAAPSPAPKRRRTSKPDSVLTDLLDTMKGHNQIISQRAPQSPCKCKNIDPFFLSAGEEFKMVANKYSLETKIGIMNTIKFYADKSREEQ